MKNIENTINIMMEIELMIEFRSFCVNDKRAGFHKFVEAAESFEQFRINSELYNYSF